ncbi:hypothetical protein ALO49_200092 [Pseudomonas savastanoi pv. retacarpa]|nr:hypothetical protein ALO49_200092 [Pseudomonas savastanoi pv. retacarpa]
MNITATFAASLGPLQLTTAGCHQAQQYLGQCAFTATRLSYNTQRFTSSYLKVNAIQSVCISPWPSKPVITDGKTNTNFVQLKNGGSLFSNGINGGIVHSEHSFSDSQHAQLCWSLIALSFGRFAQ